MVRVSLRHWIKWIGIAVGCVLFLLASAFYYLTRPMLSFDETKTLQLITASAIDPSQVYTVSRFRSGAGHDYSYGAWDGEACRSFKHYFNFSHDYNAQHIPIRSQPTASDPNINIYAPFDGKITAVDTENTPIGKQVHIRSDKYQSYTVRLFHIDLVNGLKKGSHVKSGQLMATIGPRDGTDIAIEGNILPFKVAYISYFAAMTDQAFAPWAALGYQRSDFIQTKAYRDAHPLVCPTAGSGQSKDQFDRNQKRDDAREDYLFLRPDPYGGDLQFPAGSEPTHYGPPAR